MFVFYGVNIKTSEIGGSCKLRDGNLLGILEKKIYFTQRNKSTNIMIYMYIIYKIYIHIQCATHNINVGS